MPRSSSRDVVDRFTGNRGYFHRAEPLRRWKNLATLGTVGLLLGWLVVEFTAPERAKNAHTHGELADPHAAFDTNCQACHTESSAGEFFSNPFSVFKTHERWHDLTCTKCHAGAPHHANAKDQSLCSDCHHDHNGRNFSLVKMDDTHCTGCHKELSAHQTGTPTFAESITGFAKDHPEFRSLKNVKKDGLKFNHGLHMRAGLVESENNKHKWTYRSLAESFPETKGRYSTATDNPSDPVQLQCSACHQLDTEGAYYLPVNFEQQCRACHPLKSVDGQIVPHRLQTDALRSLLRGEALMRMTGNAQRWLDKPLGPGGRLDPPAIQDATIGQELDRLTASGLQSVGHACGKCHYSPGAQKTDVKPVPDRSIWLEHAKFNHVSHRGLTCAACHPGLENSSNMDEREPPRIADIKSCQACHAKAGQSIRLSETLTVEAAGIRHSCVDCHRYHDGDHPKQGLGSPHRDPQVRAKDRLSLEQFLGGGKGKP